jgi:putative ABC transport system permease protein
MGELTEILRNLARRKLRNGLTLAGIVIGVLALVTMGAMAERANYAIDGGVRYFGDHVTVGATGNGGFANVMTLDRLEALRRVSGVAAACATISSPAKSDFDFSVSFGPGDTVWGQQPGCRAYSRYQIPLAAGRLVADEGTGEVALGHDIAHEFGWRVGDTIELPRPPKRPDPNFVSHRFRVVGVYDKTETAPDSFAVVSFRDAQAIFGDALPAALKGRVDPSTLATSAAVYAKPGVDLDQLADRINNQVTGVKAIKPTTLVDAFRAASVVLTGVTTGAAILALVIGGLSVVNTMLMAVTERVREIGLKKAVGAHTSDILREFMVESTLFGALGGAIGLLLGWLTTAVLNALLVAQNQSQLFLLTNRLVGLAVVFAIGLGIVAGLIPAFRAARLDPVTALRTQ